MTSTSAVSSSTSSSYSSSSSSSISDDFDVDALVEQAVAVKTARADTIDTKISANEVKISGYEEMQSLLSSLAESLEGLRSAPGVSGQEDDIFLNRTLTASDSNAADVLSATVEDGTTLGDHTLSITQLAKSQKIASSAQSSSSTTLGYTGTFDLASSSGTSTTISVTSDMSLTDLASAINEVKTTTGVTASVMKVSDSEYRLVLTTSDTAQTISVSNVTGTDVMTSLGVTDSDGDFSNILQNAQKAKFVVDGVEMERSSNDVDDAIDGVSLHLYGATSSTMTLTIGYDTSGIESAVEDFVEAYNAFRTFVLTNTADSSGEAEDGATITGDSTMRDIMRSLSDSLSAGNNGISMADLGLSFDSTDNSLVLDDDTLSETLLSNPTSVSSFFAYQATSSSDSLKLLRADGQEGTLTFDIEVDSDGTITSVSANGDSSLFTVSGNTISGAEGTEYEGLKFVYSGKSASISVTLSNGVAQKLYAEASAASDTTDGTIQTLIDNIEETNDDLQERSDFIRSRAEDYASYLYLKYAKISAKISEASLLVSQLKYILEADSSN